MLTRHLLSLVLFTSILQAQDIPNNVHQWSTPPPNARFEIVQSELAARWTFRIDRFTGAVFQLVVASNRSYTWEPMEVDPTPIISKPMHPHFQIFTSGIASKNTFLIDTDSGFTWALVTNKKTYPDGTQEDVSSWVQLSWVATK